MFLIAVIATSLELALNYFSQHTIKWTFGEITVTLPEIMHYGDLFIFAVFLLVSFWHILRWAVQR